jgi:hypothetical protein
MPIDPGRRLLTLAIGVTLTLALFSPLFFEIYRAAAFNTAPRDDYAPYLQYILGQGGAAPGSPMIYRPLSVIVSVPFYYGLPFYAFSNLSEVDSAYLRATAALAAVSYLSVLGSAAVLYATCRRKLHASPKGSLLIALISISLSAFVGRTGIDPLAILAISVLLFFIDRGWPFYVALALSPFINEKVVFVIGIVLFVRFAADRQLSALPRLILCAVAVAAYFVVRIVANVPGNENQLMPATFISTMLSSVPLLFSAKGVYTNLLPVILMGVLAVLAYLGISRFDLRVRVVHRADIVVFVALMLIGLAIDVDFTLGRLVMFAYPLYLPVLSLWIDKWFPQTAEAQVPSQR